jgi:uncharacterized protein
MAETEQEQPFLTLASRGVNSWWRYSLGFVVIIVGWMGIGGIISSIPYLVAMFDGDSATYIDPATYQVKGIDDLITFVFSNVSFLMLILSIWVVVRFIHKRPFLSLITPRRSFDWLRAGQGFAFFFALACVASLAEAALYPGRYHLTLDGGAWLRFLPFALVLTPIQTTAEELLMRGYVMQGIGVLTRRAAVPVLVSSLVFMSLHFQNPEMGLSPLLMALGYLGFGLLAALVTVKDNRLELAIGVHYGNYLFSWVIVNYTVSPLASPSIFTSELDPMYSLLSFIGMAAVFFLGVFYLSLGKHETEPAGDASR